MEKISSYSFSDNALFLCKNPLQKLIKYQSCKSCIFQSFNSIFNKLILSGDFFRTACIMKQFCSYSHYSEKFAIKFFTVKVSGSGCKAWRVMYYAVKIIAFKVFNIFSFKSKINNLISTPRKMK